jgi:hypothetical protein
MSHIADVFRTVETQPAFKTTPGRTALGVLGYAYQLLVSAWEDNEAGRIAAAYDHVRSIFESPDYVLALATDPDFAKEWRDEELLEKNKATAAMKIARDGFNKIEAEAGDKRYARRTKERQNLQQYSHVSTTQAGATLMQPPSAVGGRFVTPEGAMTPYNVELAIYLVHLAKELLVALAYSGLVSDAWKADSLATLASVHPYLRGINDVLAADGTA